MFSSFLHKVKILTEVLPVVPNFIQSRTYTSQICGKWRKKRSGPKKKHQIPIEQNLV